MAGKKIYRAECVWGCGRVVEARRRIPAGGIGCGQGECVAKHNEMAAQHRAEVSARRSEAAKRAAATRNQPRQAWGDWGQLVALNSRPSGPKCWNCGSGDLVTRPDEGMDGLTDETVCRSCGEKQDEA